MTTAPRVAHTVVTDLDGTLVEGKWPALGDWMPHAVEACFTLHDQGYHLICHSARLSRFNPYTGLRRSQQEILNDYSQVRSKLDSAGLSFVHIWMAPGKPSALAYIDDKAIWYPGRPGSWDAMIDIVNVRAQEEGDPWSTPILVGQEQWAL